MLRAILKKLRLSLFVGLLSLKSIVLQKYLNVAADRSHIFVEIWYILWTLTGIVFSSVTEDKFIAVCKPSTVKACSQFVVRHCTYGKMWLKK